MLFVWCLLWFDEACLMGCFRLLLLDVLVVWLFGLSFCVLYDLL